MAFLAAEPFIVRFDRVFSEHLPSCFLETLDMTSNPLTTGAEEHGSTTKMVGIVPLPTVFAALLAHMLAKLVEIGCHSSLTATT